MVVTLFGITTLVIRLSKNASEPMATTYLPLYVFGMTTFFALPSYPVTTYVPSVSLKTIPSVYSR